MANYSFRVKIDQIVTREIDIMVAARNEEQAKERALEAAQVHPEPVETKGVQRMRTVRATYWIPRDIEIIDYKEEEKPA